MFIKQENFSVTEEKKTCIVSNNTNNTIVKEIFSLLNLSQEMVEHDFEVFNTLGKLQMNKMIIVNEEKMSTSDKLSKLFDVKEDVLILVDTFEDATLLFERLTVSSYRFISYKSKDIQKEIKKYYYSNQDVSKELNEGVIYGEAINHTRDLVNKPYNYLNSIELAKYANTLNDLNNVEVKIYGKKEIEEMKMGAFLGVNKGSKDEPQLIHARYTGDPNSKDIVSLIGKGVML